MAELIREVEEFETGDEFLAALTPWSNEALFPDLLRQCVFRGHSDDDYKLIPSALREGEASEFWKLAPYGTKSTYESDALNQISHEYKILRSFYKNADRNGLYLPDVERIRELLLHDDDHIYFHPWSNVAREIISDRRLRSSFRWLSDDLMEVAGIAQHYGLPTRLLDWTYDPLVAAYFAAKSAKADKYFSVWALRRVRVQSSISRRDIGLGTLKFITPSYHGNPNLAAQAGLFTCWQIPVPMDENGLIDQPQPVDPRPLNELIAGHIRQEYERPNFSSSITVEQALSEELFVKLKTHSRNARRVIDLLNRMNYNAARLFPGYDGVVQQMHDEIFDPYPDE